MTEGDDPDAPRGEIVTCSVCGDEIGRGPAGLGQKQHAKKHRRQFKEAVGRWPDSYQEVRDVLAPPGGPRVDPGEDQPTIWETLTDDQQASLREVGE